MPANTPSPAYAEMVQEIEEIVQELESANVSMDALSAKVKRALTLLAACTERLRKTEDEIAHLQSACD